MQSIYAITLWFYIVAFLANTSCFIKNCDENVTFNVSASTDRCFLTTNCSLVYMTLQKWWYAGLHLYNDMSELRQNRMTIRSLINEKKRKISLTLYSGFTAFIVGIFLIPVNRIFFILALFAFAVVFITMIYAFYRVRCPRCNNSWGYIAMYPGGPFSISKKLKFCPYCVESLGSDLYTDPKEL